MNIEQLNRVESSINAARDSASKAQGAMEQIDQDLANTHGLKSVEETEATIETLTSQISSINRRIETEEDILRSACSAAGVSL